MSRPRHLGFERTVAAAVVPQLGEDLGKAAIPPTSVALTHYNDLHYDLPAAVALDPQES
jgi:hypothetical protein